VDFDLPADDAPERLEVREWFTANPQPTGRQLAEAGFVVPHWPRPWGLDASPILQLVIDDEMRRAKVARPQNQIGIGWAGPTILYAGSDEQKDRYLSPLLAGEEVWCQLFSEPGAGSDLASLTTRAVRDGDEFIVNGQRSGRRPRCRSSASSSRAPTSTSRSTAASRTSSARWTRPASRSGRSRDDRHGALQRGLLHRRAPARDLVGDLNGDGRSQKVTLANERSLSGGGALWEADHRRVTCSTRSVPRWSRRPRMRQRLAALHIEAEVLGSSGCAR
jgi:hypothetical protein